MSVPPTLYRVVDPIENFKIKISVREVSRLLTSQADEEYIPFKTDVVINWQQKIHGPLDIADYLKNKRTEHNKGTPSQIDSRREISEISKHNGTNDENLLSPVMLYTYIDRDKLVTSEPKLLMNCSGKESYVGNAVKYKKEKQNDEITPNAFSKFINSRSYKVEQRENKTKFKSMYICLATDVKVNEIISDSDISIKSDCFSEHLLCSIKLFHDGFLFFLFKKKHIITKSFS